MKLRLRWSGDQLPMHGEYLMAPRGRGGYLILNVTNRGRRGGVGQPVRQLLIVDVERVSRQTVLNEIKNPDGPECWKIFWDRRIKSKRATR